MLPFGLYLGVLGHYFTYFGGLGRVFGGGPFLQGTSP